MVREVLYSSRLDKHSLQVTIARYIHENFKFIFYLYSSKQIFMKHKLLFTGIILLFIAVGSTAQNTWIQKANFSGRRSGAVGFSIGTKGYMGTGFDSSLYHTDFWEYDPSGNTWTQKANVGGNPRSNAIGISIGSLGYIGTGSTGPSQYTNDWWEYDPSVNTWTQKTSLPGNARGYASAFSVGVQGYISLGYASGPYFNDVWEYDQVSDTWTQQANFSGTARVGGVGFTIGANGYVATGSDQSGSLGELWQYDTLADTWAQKAGLPSCTVYPAAGFAVNGKGYIGTGNFQNIGDLAFWEYDPGTNSWAQVANFSGVARQYATGFAIGSNGYIGCGEALNGGNYLKDFWEYTPCSTPIPSVSFSGNDTVCGNDSILLTSSASSGNQWYFNGNLIPGAIQQTYYASQTGPYTVTSSCSAQSGQTYLTFLDNNTIPSICLVTVDTSINKNVIIWEEVTDPLVVSYNIYKETTQAGVYAMIGNVPVTSLSTFTDNASVPQQVAARYKLVTVDTCGVESGQSPNHKTIHLTISQGIPPAYNLNWDNYEGITFGQYKIWRGNTSGSLTLIDSVQSSLNSYTDLNPPTGTIYYAIQIVYPQGCNPSFKMQQPASTPVSTSVSNTISNLNIGMNEVYNNYISCIFPNPFSGTTNIRLDSKIKEADLVIYDLLGNVVSSIKLNKENTVFDRAGLNNGAYYYKVSAGSVLLSTGKLIIE
jgi:hypothetical protein